MAGIIKVEEAKSNRSKCRATGDTIEKGELRVGMDVWTSGRMATNWQKAEPFLKACSVEYCSGNKSNFGTCKATSHKFKKGDVRFICSCLGKKIYMTMQAASEQLRPIFEAVGPEKFGPLDIEGLDTLTASDREDFFKHFSVPAADAKKFNADHPAPAQPPEASPPAKRQKRDSAAAKGGKPEETAAAGADTKGGKPEAAAAAASDSTKKPAAAKGGKPEAAATAASDSTTKPAADKEGGAEGDAADGSKKPVAEKDAKAPNAAAATKGKKPVTTKKPKIEAAADGHNTGAAGAASEEAQADADEDAKGKMHAAAAAQKSKTPAAAAQQNKRGRKRGRQAAGDDAAEEPSDKAEQAQQGALDVEAKLAASADDEVTEGAPQQADDISEYERQRMEQIARNRARLMALNLPSLAAQAIPVAPSKPLKSRGIAARKLKVKVEPGPRRMSLRNQGISADGVMIHDERRNGELLLVNGEAIHYPATQEARPPRDRHPKEAVSFKSLHALPASDEAFLQLLQRTMSSQGASTSAATSAAVKGKPKANAKGGSCGPPAVAALRTLRLDPEDVAKVNTNGIVHLAFHPGSDALIIASADKSGHVGLWNVDRKPEPAATAGAAAGKLAGDADDAGGDDGVLEFEPHYSYVCGLRWAGGSGAAARLFTASYDGSVRMLDPAAGTFELVLSSEDAELSAFDCLADAQTGFVGDKDGNLDVFDVRARKLAHDGVNIHEKKINTLHVEPSEERLLASASGDNTICLWDMRKLGKGMTAVASARHPQTCLSAYFAPDGSQRVLSTSRDNTLAIWDGRASLTRQVSIQHNNNTGRWVVPFRATWGPAADCLVVGNMKRLVDIFSTSGAAEAALSSDYMTAITSRNVFHPQLPVLACGSASGRMHIYR